MYGNPFDEEIRKLTDKELVRMIFNDPENFNPLAINAAKNELEVRGLNNNATTKIRENNLSTKFNEIENYKVEKKFRWFTFILHFFLGPFGWLIDMIFKTNLRKNNKN